MLDLSQGRATGLVLEMSMATVEIYFACSLGHVWKARGRLRRHRWVIAPLCTWNFSSSSSGVNGESYVAMAESLHPISQSTSLPILKGAVLRFVSSKHYVEYSGTLWGDSRERTPGWSYSVGFCEITSWSTGNRQGWHLRAATASEERWKHIHWSTAPRCHQWGQRLSPADSI